MRRAVGQEYKLSLLQAKEMPSAQFYAELTREHEMEMAKLRYLGKALADGAMEAQPYRVDSFDDEVTQPEFTER